MSTHENDELGRLLTQELHRRTDGLHGTPLGFDDVRGKATSIRRRRRVATGLAAAAAVAVIVPTAILATSGPKADGPPVVTQSPSVVDTSSPPPTSTPTMGSDPHALDVRDLPTGAPPSIGYEDDARSGQVRQYVDLGDVQVRSENSQVRVTGPGGIDETWDSESVLAVNESHNVAAWVTLDGTVMVWQAGRTEALELGTTDISGAQAEAVTGDDCVSAEGTCVVWLRGSTVSPYEPVSVTVASTGVVAPLDQLAQVRDATDAGLVVGATEIGTDGSCSAVLDLQSTKTRFTTCDYQLDTVSPSGDYVLASEPFHSGNLNGKIAILDARTGDVLASRTALQGDSAFYDQAVWEDGEHVLFTAFQDGKWSVVRMTVAGAMEFALAPVDAGDAMARPFVLETR